MYIRQLVESAKSGEISIDDVKQWIHANQPLYVKPPLHDVLKDASSEEVDHIIDEYSDWELRAHELARALTDLNMYSNQISQQNPERALEIARVSYELATHLGDNNSWKVQSGYLLGYSYWLSNRYYEASVIFAEIIPFCQSEDIDPQLTLFIYSYLSDSLRAHKQYDDTIKYAEEYRSVAQKYHCRGHEALALRDHGAAHAALGREKESLSSLQEAVEIRKQLSEEEVYEQNIISLWKFLHDYGLALRGFGHYDNAHQAFLENVDVCHKEGDQHCEALALSEIAYTYNQSGNQSKAIEYLRAAVEKEEYAGQTENSKRWRLQIITMTDTQSDDIVPDIATTDLADSQSDSFSVQYLLEQAVYLATNNQNEAAIEIAESTLPTLIKTRNANSEVVCRNILGVCYERLDKPEKSVEHFEKGIQLSDGVTGGASSSLMLRYNLAKALYKFDRLQRCNDVLIGGIAYSRSLISRSTSYAFRKQVAAEALKIYELHALLHMNSDPKENAYFLLALSDKIRSRNIATWAQVQAVLNKVTTNQSEIEHIIERNLKTLLATEIKLDYLHETGDLSVVESEHLQDVITSQIQAIEDVLQKHDLSTLFGAESEDTPNTSIMREKVKDILSPGSAILSTFCIPEGICLNLFSMNENGEVEIDGKILGWQIEDRQNILSEWASRSHLQRSRQATYRSVAHTPGMSSETYDSLNVSIESSLTTVLDVFQEKLFDHIIALLKQYKVKQLSIVIHRELSLVPYWNLVDQCESLESITLVPSVEMLQICKHRKRQLTGNTCLVSDYTDTLPLAQKEIEFIRDVRDGKIDEVKGVSELVTTANACNVLHVAAHGVFSSDNIYLSGFLLGKPDSQTTDLFARFARPTISAEGLTFEFFDKAVPGSHQLMTMADCLSRLSLDECRLAILSTCESGLADTHGGGELIGLPNSLLVSGAKTVIASLWPTDDVATYLLVEQFYKIWKGGIGDNPSPAASLTLARDTLKKASREAVLERFGDDVYIPNDTYPYAAAIYSDAFQCFGDW